MSILFASLIIATLTPAVVLALLALLGSEPQPKMQRRLAVVQKSQRHLRPHARDLD